METYYDDNDNRLRVTGVTDADGAVIADATVQVTAIVRGSTAVTAEGEALALITLNADETAGEYSVVLPRLDVSPGDVCRATIEVDHAGRHAAGVKSFRVRTRTL